MKLKIALTTIGILCLAQNGVAAEFYVDPSIGATNCNNYDVSSRSCGSGPNTAYSGLSGALDAAAAGDTVVLRGGTYGQVNVPKSGAAGSPITIEGYDGESARVTGGSFVGLWIIGRNNVTIRNLTVDNVEGFGRIEESSNIVIRNIDFSNASSGGTTGSLKFVRSTGNKVQDSSFRNGSDLLLLQDGSDENLIEGSVFGPSSHSLISIRCGNRNVIRGNEFANPSQKGMEVFDCEGVSDAPILLDSATRNIIEENRFLATAASGQSHNYNAIQHGGQNTIVRRNIFANNLGGGVNYQYYSDESLYVYGNRLYNNTFYNNRCYAIIGNSGPTNRYYDNRVVNNLLYGNHNCSGSGSQTSVSNPTLVILDNNTEATTNPGFVNAANNDFHLDSGCAQIDAGRFLAQTLTAGSGTVVTLDDASWFYDGYGIAGEHGDTVQIEGHSETAVVVAIDNLTNTITVDKPLTWSLGSGVSLVYNGAAPDVGALEFGQAAIKPKPPGNLEAQ